MLKTLITSLRLDYIWILEWILLLFISTFYSIFVCKMKVTKLNRLSLIFVTVFTSKQFENNFFSQQIKNMESAKYPIYLFLNINF